MLNLTFGEQVKIILSRKGMTIKQLAELVEAHTGKPMSRQNMTQRLGRDNFQEKDMRLIAEILDCKFQLSILDVEDVEEESAVEVVAEESSLAREITIGDLVPEEPEAEELVVEESVVDEVVPEPVKTEENVEETKEKAESDERSLLRRGVRGYFKKQKEEKTPVAETSQKEEKEEIVGDINPYTRKEYKTNSVRMHPKRIGYVQVYDQEQHKWTDMTEWAFLGYQERKKALLGKDYEPPTYLD